MTLVQCTINEVMSIETDYAGELYCTRCGSLMGPVTKAELRHLLYSNDPNDVLCFECEKVAPRATRRLTVQEHSNLMRLFDITSVSELPISAVPVWENVEIGAYLQLWPRCGYHLWYPLPDGEQVLRCVRLPYERTLHLRELFNLSPAMYKDKSLV